MASTISKIINLDTVDENLIPFIVLAALIGAISWNLITWWSGLPTSSSHALIGGLVGAGLAAAGIAAVKFSTVGVIAVFMFVSPIVGLAAGFLFMAIVLWVTRDAHRTTAEGYFRRLQLFSAAAYSYSHGTNDAQKTMGIVTLALVTGGYLDVFVVPVWVIILCAGMIALGTAVGGWKLIKTLGGKFYKIRPVDGFASQLASAVPRVPPVAHTPIERSRSAALTTSSTRTP